MNIIKPKKLQKGNTIGIIAVSGCIKEYDRIENAKKFFEDNGYNVVISESCKSNHRYMAGISDEDCVDTLHNFFENKSIDAILCARGGYGTLRLLDKVDWDLIKHNPKIFAGYSDITILLNMIFKKSGLITFHSAMPNGDFSAVIEDYTKESFFETLSGNKKFIKAYDSVIYKEGMASGCLWGGNLASLVSLCGMDFIPNDDLILFIEDLNEPIYKIDRMLTQLFNIDKVKKNVKGLIIGEFKDIDNKSLFDEIITEFAQNYKIPASGGFKITHNKIKDTLPVGIKSTFDSKKGFVYFDEDYIS